MHHTVHLYTQRRGWRVRHPRAGRLDLPASDLACLLLLVYTRFVHDHRFAQSLTSRTESPSVQRTHGRCPCVDEERVDASVLVAPTRGDRWPRRSLDPDPTARALPSGVPRLEPEAASRIV